jgi:hypothetical protein
MTSQELEQVGARHPKQLIDLTDQSISRFQDCNDRTCQLLGFTAWTPGPLSPASLECRFVRRDGSAFVAQVRVTRVGPDPFQGVVRGLSERRRLAAPTGLPASAYVGTTNCDLGFPVQRVDFWEDACTEVFDTALGMLLIAHLPVED